MKKRVYMLSALLLAALLFVTSIIPVSLAESNTFSKENTLSLHDVFDLMDAFESREFESVWEQKALEKENAQHTKEWEKEYGKYTRWQGNVTAAYVQAYGFMPSHDTLSVNPLCVLPHRDSLSIYEAYDLAAKAVSRKEKRLPREKLDKYFYTWEYCVSRELDWFWNPLGTWIITWYDTHDRLVCRAYVDDCARKVTIVFDYLDRTPDDEGIKIYKNF